MTAEIVDLPQGQVRHDVRGPADSTQPPVVLLHGLLVDGGFWTKVADSLAARGIRSYAPTLPLGSHRPPMRPDADLSPRGIARLVLDYLEARRLDDVTLVGNDTGGAICQFVLDTDARRIGRLVLTDCDGFDTFPPRPLKPLFYAMRHPAVVAAMLPGLRTKPVRHGPLAYGPLSVQGLDPATTRAWVEPLQDRAIRGDLARFARGVDPQELLAVSTRLKRFDRPVRVVWGTADPFFRPDLGRRLAAAFPDATLTMVSGGRTFLPLDKPEIVTNAIESVGTRAAEAA